LQKAKNSGDVATGCFDLSNEPKFLTIAELRSWKYNRTPE